MEQERARQLLSEERGRLEALLEGHRRELGAAQGDDELSSFDQHQADEGSELYDREDLAGRAARVEEELAAVARAERRLEEGTYGVSVESGAPIPDARLERLPAAERTAEEEGREERHPPAARAPEDADDSTPLDDPAPPPPDLADIPLSDDHDPTVDPQEEDDQVRVPISGEAYEGEGGAPDVGEPEGDDPALDRRYRPER